MNNPDSDRLDQGVRLAIYRHFRDYATAPTVETTAATLGESAEAVRAAYRRLAERHTIVLQPDSDQIWMAMPFSAVPTAFQVTSGEQAWWANCAWDALGIPTMLGQDADIASDCPDCGAALALQVRAGALVPTDNVLHFALPAARWWDDIGYT